MHTKPLGLAMATAIVLLASACTSQPPAPTPSVVSSVTQPAFPASLLEPGRTIEVPASDAEGEWGTIEITRGDDIGGFPYAPAADDAFLLEIHVDYQYERTPDGEFGIDDWAVATASDRRPVGRVFEPPTPDDPSVPIEGLSIGTFPGAMVMERSMGGDIYFELPMSAAGEELVLIYRPAGFEEAVAAIPVRSPGEAPEPVAAATPAPTPAPLAYVDRRLDFTVIDSEEADALFADPDTCTNDEAGYTVTYPDAWYTNTAVGDTPACSWFSPVIYEVDDSSSVPDDIAITIGSFIGDIGFVHQPVYTVQDQVEVAGSPTSRTEELGGFGADGFLPRSRFTYQYMVRADEHSPNLKVFGTTSNEMSGDYDLNKAVLDRIMASMQFDDRPSEDR